MLRINQLKLLPGEPTEHLEKKICRILHLKPGTTFQWKMIRQSVDARKKPEIYMVCTVEVSGLNEKKILQHPPKNVTSVSEKAYRFSACGTMELKQRPVVIGSGPAGLFCTYLLAKYGYRPILLERGKDAKSRQKDVETFWKSGTLNPESNVQFGEGGAGTFSDGKLNTLVKDKLGRSKFVLETFVTHGAPERILYEAKPHIGTDILIPVITEIRRSIEKLGGEVLFQSKVTDFELKEKENRRILSAVIVNDTKRIPCDLAVLALGHSARDTFETLYRKQVPMEAKSFAVGVRAEHPQEMIDQAQYGRKRGTDLPSSPYKLTAQTKSGRGVYSFCMCPGGYVVNASSEPGRLAVNGMSYSGRDGENANSALIVTITPEDYGTDSPLDGMEFQRRLEEKAYELGQGKIPIQQYGDFCKNVKSTEFGEVKPQLKGEYSFANLRELFPNYLSDALMEAMETFEQKIHGFSRPDTLFSGVESRTSSPVKLPRNEECESPIEGLYPCGEGAGYAGGITSAAMDGMKVAEAIGRKYAPMTDSRTYAVHSGAASSNRSR